MKKIATALFFLLVLTSVVLPTIPIPTALSPSTTTAFPSVTPDLSLLAGPTPLAPRTVRVAIYREANLSLPTYGSGSMTYNGLDNLSAVLLGAGYQVTNLTASDISNHELLTANYDVFIIPDNLPRENITNQVKEFWLSGGGILSFDSGICYVCYAGMLPHESENMSGFGLYWTYSGLVSQHNVTTRHPVTKSYNVNQRVNSSLILYGSFFWSVLQTTSAAGDVVMLGHKMGYSDLASMVAYESSHKGGRVVQLPLLGPVPMNMEDLVIDAVDWLCPRPKARILYDLSHIPYYGIDPWDYIATFPPGYTALRNALVNRSYTFDKLWPSAAGNLTATNLAPYDILITFLPQVNYTAAEVTAVTDWITGGGALLGLGDWSVGPAQQWSEHLNYLFSNLDLRINNTVYGNLPTISYTWPHPTLESGLTQLTMGTYGYVNLSGPAFPIWGENAGNVVVGAQDYGSGRVLLIGDANPLETFYLSYSDNYQFAVNVFNWLSAASADVLLYVDEYPGAPDPNDNLYRSPVAQALNDLDISFYLTFDAFYFNMSLVTGSWNLVIIDNPYEGDLFPTYDDDILDYAKTGGHLILSTWEYWSTSEHLWSFMGFNVTDATSIYTPPTIYIWDPTHDIFTQPNDYAASTMSDYWDFVGLDCRNVTVLTNGTAIAGLGASPSTTNATIILGNFGRTIANTLLLTSYYGDTDDSTYPDALEIWENEIAFMLRPRVDFSPGALAPATAGTTLTVTVDLGNVGLRAAHGGEVTLSVPSGLGTLATPATQFFTSPLGPGGTDTLTWQIDVTGAGDFTLDFTASWNGLPGTSYSATFDTTVHSEHAFDVDTTFTPGSSAPQGTPITVNLTVTNLLGDVVTDATITSTIDTTTVTFTHTSGGVYLGTIDTASLSPASYTLDIEITKTGYTTYSASHTITIEQPTPPIIPGFPPLAIAIGAAVAVSLGLIARRRKR